MTRMAALALLALTADSAASRSAVHEMHLTHARMVIEGRRVVCRIRVFRDDAEIALRRFSGRPEFKLTGEARADSLFATYAAKHLLLRDGTDTLKFRVTSSGAEHDPDAQEVIWYVLESEAPRPVTRLGVLNGMMFELYRDQQNSMQVLRLPGEERKTLYFVSTDPREQII
jgi:hypothetical protein